MKSIAVLVMAGLLFFAGTALAGRCRLAWDPPDISTDVTGYMIHYGTASGLYDQTLDVGLVLSAEVSGLTAGVVHYFAVTAYNAVGYESVYSNEVSLRVAPDPFQNVMIVAEWRKKDEKAVDFVDPVSVYLRRRDGLCGRSLRQERRQRGRESL